MDSADFARWFRDSTPYISAHRKKTFVVMLGADAIGSKNLVNMVHDLALLHVLGAKLVLVHGARAQGLQAEDVCAPDADAMQSIVASIGVTRSRLEAIFSTGIPSSPLRASRITLASGNLVTAKPLGVIDGIDRLYAGDPRRIHVDEIRTMLNNDAIVLLPPLGYSTSGEAYVLCEASLAAEVAAAIGADKLIVYDAIERLNGASDMTPLLLEQALAEGNLAQPTRSRLNALLHACRQGVARGHVISYETDGALLRELFTAEGVGTQISEQDYRSIRPATHADVAGIVELIRPLEDAGALVRRPRDRLEAEIEHFSVAELDGILIGCCALYPHGKAVELGCLATHPSYREQVNGETLGARVLAYAEAAAGRDGFERIFVLTTRAQDWFALRGFQPADIADLPASKQVLYNYQRNSKVMIKELTADGR